MAESTRELIHRLSLVRFLERELEALRQQYRLPSRTIIALQAQVRSRRWELYTALYRIAVASERWHLAYRSALQFSRYSPYDQQVFAQLGRAAAKVGQQAQAITAFERSIGLGNRSRELFLELSGLYAQTNHTNQAILALLAGQSEKLVLDPASAVRYQALTDAVRKQPVETSSLPTSMVDTHERLAYMQRFVLRAANDGLIDKALAETISTDLRAREAKLPLDQRLSQKNEPTVAIPNTIAQHQAPEPQAPSAKPTAAPSARPSTPPVAVPPFAQAPHMAGAGLAMASTAQAAVPPRKSLDWNEIWGALFSERMLRTLLYLGAALLVLSAFMWVLFNWQEFLPVTQLAVLSTITGAFYAGGYTLMKRLNLQRSGMTLIAVGAGWVPSIGWVLGLPGLLNLDGSMTWIVISALCVLAYTLSLWWLKSELFSTLLGVAGISLSLALMHKLALEVSQQAFVLQLLMIGFVGSASMIAQRGSQLGRPLHWIAQGLTPIILIGSVVLWYNAPPSSLFMMMLTWWAGFAFYAFCWQRFGGLIYEQAVVWIIPVLLFSSLRTFFDLPSGWYGSALLLLTPFFLWFGVRRHAVLKASYSDWRALPLSVPAYSATYLLALLALFWLGQTPTMATATAFGISLLCIVSTVLFKRQVWSWLSVASLIWSFYRLLVVLELSYSHAMLVWVMVAALFWLVGALLERRPVYANAPLAVGYAMAGLLSFALVFYRFDPTSQLVGLGMMAALWSVSALWWRGPERRLAVFGAIDKSILELASYLVGFALWSGLAIDLTIAYELPVRETAFVTLGLAVFYLVSGSILRFRTSYQRLAKVLLGSALGMTASLPLVTSFDFRQIFAVVLLNMFGFLIVLGNSIWRETLVEIDYFPEPLEPVRISLWDVGALMGSAILAILLFVGIMPEAQQGFWWPSLLLTLVGMIVFGSGLFFKHAAWFYAAGSSLILASVLLLQSIGWNVSYSLWFSLAASWSMVAWSASYLAERRALQNTAFSGLIYATGTGAIGLSLALASLLTLGQLNWLMPLGCLVLLLVTSLAALHRSNQALAALASLIGVLAVVGINQLGNYSASWHSIAFACLVLVYLNIAALGERKSFSQLRIFRMPLYLTAYAITPIAVLMGLRADLPSAASSLILALSFGALAIVRRRWLLGSIAALLLPWAATQAWFYQAALVFGSSSLALFWLAISVALVGIGLSMRYLVRSQYALPYYLVGFALGVVAPVFAINNQLQLLIALAVQVVWWIGWAVLSGRGHLMSEGFLKAGARRELMQLFVLPIAPIASIWLWILCDYLSFSVSQTGLAFALAALLWMLVGRALYRIQAQLSFVLTTCICAALALMMPNLLVPWPLALGLGGLLLSLVYGDFYRLKQPYLSIFTWFVAGLWAISTIVGMYASFAFWQVRANDTWLPPILAISLLACSFSAVQPERRPIWQAFGVLNLTPLLIVSLLVYLPTGFGLEKIFYILLGFAYLAALLAWNTRRLAILSEALQASLRYALHLNVGLIAVISIGSAWFAAITAGFAGPERAGQFESLVLNLGMSLLFVLYAWRQRQAFWLYFALAVSFLIPNDYTWFVAENNLLLRGSLMLLASLSLFGLGYWAKLNLDLRWARPLFVASNLWALRSLLFMQDEPRALSTALFVIVILYGLHVLVWHSRIWLWAALFALHAWLMTLSVALGWSTSYFDYLRIGPFTFFAIEMALIGMLVEYLLPNKNDPRPQILDLNSWAQPFYAVSLFTFLETFLWVAQGNGVASEIVGLIWGFALTCLVLGGFWRVPLVMMFGLATLLLGNDYYLAQIVAASDIQRLALASSSAVALWWMGFGLKSWSGLWEETLQVFSLPVNIVTLFIGFAAVFRNPSDTMPLITALAIGGLFYTGVAYQERWYWLSYLASGMLVCAWIIAAFTYMPEQPQLYALPAGAYLLLVAAAERFRAGHSLPVQVLDLLGVAILLGVTFAQSLPHNFSYGMILGIEALIVIVLGIVQRVRLLFFAGLVAFILNVAVQSLSVAQQLEKTLVAFVIGLILVTVAVFVERKRDYLLAQSRRLWAEFETWN
jgi:hypothetical protein